jgi:hypothetical protein
LSCRLTVTLKKEAAAAVTAAANNATVGHQQQTARVAKAALPVWAWPAQLLVLYHSRDSTAALVLALCLPLACSSMYHGGGGCTGTTAVDYGNLATDTVPHVVHEGCTIVFARASVHLYSSEGPG